MPKTIAIIGASTGLGCAAANVLAREHRVIVCGRDVERTRAAVPGAAEALRVDLNELADVARLGDELAARGPLDALVCNAGVQSLEAPRFTRDGYDETFAVNHLAHFALATKLGKSAGRVVFVGSATHHPKFARSMGFRGGRYTSARQLAAGEGDPAVDDAQRGNDRYATSKLCNLLTTYALVRRGVDAYALDPGLMPGTNLARERGVLTRFAWHWLKPVIGFAMPGTSSARRSGSALAWLATSDALDPAQRYYDYRKRPIQPWSEARREDWQEELYATSVELITSAGSAGSGRAPASSRGA
jgi:NAD(P)-dependent dehydrogenase (short-subunit alcohol dehydrogenase family)